MYRCQQNVYTDTTGTETYLGVQPKPKWFDFTKFFSGIGHLMASTKVACFTQHYRTFKLHKTTQQQPILKELLQFSFLSKWFWAKPASFPTSDVSCTGCIQ